MTSYFNPTELGAKRKPPTWFHGVTLRHPKPAAFRARVDKSTEDYQRRLIPAIGTEAHKDYIGADFGDGFICVATDGHRALCTRGTPRADARSISRAIAGISAEHAAITITPDMQLMLQRARVVTGNRIKDRPLPITLAVDPIRRRLHVWSKEAGAIDAHEWADLAVGDQAVKGTCLKLDIQYLLDGLGRPAARLFYIPNADQRAVVIISDDDRVRYVLMGMRQGKAVKS